MAMDVGTETGSLSTPNIVPLIAHAIDIMRGAGMDKIGLITAKLEAGE